jgi:succinate-acetate transporter protein
MSEYQPAATPPVGTGAAATGTVGGPIIERPLQAVVADPAPLGLAAFALTTFVLSLSNANVWPGTGAAVALALAYGGIVQLLAGMWEFRRNNTFGATAFSSYGGFWISFFALIKLVPASLVNGQTLGLYLLAWAFFTLYMTVASLRVSGAVLAVFVLLTITFFLLSIGQFEASSGWLKAGGWVGVATAAAAWYASFAGVTNSTFGRIVLPVYPLNV